MAQRIPEKCLETGCKTRTTNGTGFCDLHVKQNYRTRQRAAYGKNRYDNSPWGKWYHSSAWRRLVEWFWTIPENAICAGILENGQRCTRPATQCDHRVPHKGDWGLFMDRANLQGLCASHHSEKTAREDGGFGHAIR
jgi:5-methylcytosine-specific restriction enzyme A